jgi:hypothetical protein
MALEALEDRRLLSGSIPLNAFSWTPIGPAPITDSNPLGPGYTQPTNFAGRITGVAGSPTDPNTLYIAAAGGGVWKTTNAGQSWTPLTDGQSTMFMGSIAVAPSNANVIYAGTGEADNSLDLSTPWP